MEEATDVEKLVQVAPAHYNPVLYLEPPRMASIGYQFQLLHRHFPTASVLEVGPGPGLTTDLLRKLGHLVKTLDVDKNLNPDLVGSVTHIPSTDVQFEAFICYQVLEHIPWDQVDLALKELHRIARLGGVISVPTLRPRAIVGFHNWKKTRFRSYTLPHKLGKPIRTSDQHFWELEANVRTDSFSEKLKAAGFNILKEFQPPENPYHHFFVLIKPQ